MLPVCPKCEQVLTPEEIEKGHKCEDLREDINPTRKDVNNGHQRLNG